MFAGKEVKGRKMKGTDIVRQMRFCRTGKLYDVYIDSEERGILKCIQETSYLIVFQDPEYRYRWRKYVVDKRDVVGNKVWIKEV